MMSVYSGLVTAENNRRSASTGLASIVSLFLACLPLSAQTIGSPPAERQEREKELRNITDKIQRSEAEQNRLKSEIDGLKGDRARLNQELLKSAASVREAEDRVAAAQARLDEVKASEMALRHSLELRRETITEVLAALQRSSRKPPPAVLVRPEDILEAIRAAILLSDVFTGMRSEVDTLVADLQQLVRLRDAADVQTKQLGIERDKSTASRERLRQLVAARQGQIENSETSLTQERQRIEDLTRQAQSLKDLVARAENDTISTQRALEQARQSPAQARTPQELAALTESAFKDPARLAPRIAFADAKGLLALPVSGAIVKNFGAGDGIGGTEKGITIATRPESIVTAPCDGWILFAGPYRSLGRVLIINAGNGYNFVLTGLNQSSVEVGQFVLTGEPIGAMGQNIVSALDSRVEDGAKAGPTLYVELRKDGSPVDPSPWWTKNFSEKARG